MTDLIPRDVLFGNPEKTMPALSPDGRRIAYLAPHDDVLSIWVRTVGAEDDRVVATDPVRPIRNVFWSPGGERILFLQDAGGDENGRQPRARVHERGASLWPCTCRTPPGD